MSNDNLASLRRHVHALLEGGHAFARPDAILADIPAEARGASIAGFEHSIWQLLEHLRIAQRDILDFCVAEHYTEIEWPRQYWPMASAPESAAAWDESLSAFLADLDEARRLALDETIDLFAIVPHGTTQTWLRELLLITEHNAHHLGQIIVLRKLLGAWDR